MEKHKEYLKQIVRLPDDELMKSLRRNGVVEKISQEAPVGN
jgi:hypothetical protein